MPGYGDLQEAERNEMDNRVKQIKAELSQAAGKMLGPVKEQILKLQAEQQAMVDRAQKKRRATANTEPTAGSGADAGGQPAGGGGSASAASGAPLAPLALKDKPAEAAESK